MALSCRKCRLRAPVEAIHCPRCGEPLHSFPGWRVLWGTLALLLVLTLACGYVAHWF